LTRPVFCRALHKQYARPKKPLLCIPESDA
jgi:hypothetical protein